MQKIESAETIRQFIISKTPSNWVSGDKFLNGADRFYWLPTYGDLEGILARCHIAHHGDQGDVFDCDEYASALKTKLSYLGMENRGITGGYPICTGTFWGRAEWVPDDLHAANWFVTREDDLVWVEPQYNNKQFQNDGHDPIRPLSEAVTYLQVMIF